jgi:hypothetical protein
MPDLFEIAARKKFRFPSNKGLLTVEQLYDLPLTGATSLNSVAIAIDDELETTGRRSFVSEACTNPGRRELALKLDIVKHVISTKQDEAAARAEAAERKERKQKLLAAIEAAEGRELGAASSADLRKQLAALDD